MSALSLQPRSGRHPRTQPRLRHQIRLGLGALLAASLACGGDSTGPEAIEGTYALKTMAGQSLPVTVLEDETGKYEITAGSVTLTAPNAFTLSLTFRQTSGTDVNTLTSDVDGTWTRSGDSVTLTTSEGDSIVATLSGQTLRIMGEAEGLGTVEWVFSK
jgi:hypothetical protein